MAEPLIRAQKIVKTFNTGRSNELTVLHELDIEVGKNTFVLLKGPSGSGKTTLLTILGCLARPTSGNLRCMGEEVSHWPEKFLTRFRQKYIGVVFQNFNLIGGLTAFRNIAAALIPRNLSNKAIDARVRSAAEQVRIGHRLDFHISELSGGEMQRVAVARCLVGDPQIIIADEPTAHLDSRLASEIIWLFNQMKRNGKTVIVATHDPLVQEQADIDRVLCIRDGQLQPEE